MFTFEKQLTITIPLNSSNIHVALEIKLHPILHDKPTLCSHSTPAHTNQLQSPPFPHTHPKNSVWNTAYTVPHIHTWEVIIYRTNSVPPFCWRVKRL